MNTTDAIALVAMVVGLGSLLVSIWSYQAGNRAVEQAKLAADQALKAAIYDKRFEIYSDAQKFIAAWSRNGKPDLGLLSVLVGARDRSHFLYGPEVTAYLRKIWIDSVQADYDSQVIGGAVSDDREKALARRRAMIDTADLDKLREVFKPDLKV